MIHTLQTQTSCLILRVSVDQSLHSLSRAVCMSEPPARASTLMNDLGKVIEAWELAIPTMKVGEKAEIVCTSDYGEFMSAISLCDGYLTCIVNT